ncbi:MAG: glycosyltransferase family 4 protein [Treponema sp.]|nr:glycosyltransferase family 4 protein [Treponema sp.]
MEKEKFWILSELFYPEEASTAYILTKIANTLAQKYEIHVVAGSQIYEEKKFNKDDLHSDVIIHRSTSKQVNKNSVFSRVFRALKLGIYFKKFLKKNAKSGEKVLAVTNPVFNILSISKICKKNNLKLVILVHDVFPENTVAAGFLKKNSIFLRILVSFFNKAYRRAETIITIGSDMEEIVKRKVGTENVKIFTIPNWANTSQIKMLPNLKKEKIIIKFAGNLGRVQGLETVLPILDKVSNPNIVFVFQGNGAYKELVRRYQSDKIVVCDSYKREEEQNVLSETDIGLVCLNNDMFGLGVPSKTYNLLAAGKPVLFIGPQNSEIYNLIIENDIGWAFDINDSEKIIEFINSIDSKLINGLPEIGKKARKLAEIKYDENVILQQYFDFL